jgi:hypothetical protein
MKRHRVSMYRISAFSVQGIAIAACFIVGRSIFSFVTLGISLTIGLLLELFRHFEQQRNKPKLDEPIPAIQMFSLGAFPEHLDPITKFILNDGHPYGELSMLGDTFDYGGLSAPQLHREHLHAIVAVRSRGTLVRQLICGEPAAITMVSGLREKGFANVRKTHEFKEYLDYHGLPKAALEMEAEFVAFLRDQQEKVRRYLLDNNVLSFNLPDEQTAQFLWIKDDAAILVISRAGDKAEALYCKDPQMVKTLKAMFESYWRKLPGQVRGPDRRRWVWRARWSKRSKRQ